MILISKKERDYLLDNGAKWHSDIHRTYSNKKTYYMTESQKMMKLLNDYRDKGDK